MMPEVALDATEDPVQQMRQIVALDAEIKSLSSRLMAVRMERAALAEAVEKALGLSTRRRRKDGYVREAIERLLVERNEVTANDVAMACGASRAVARQSLYHLVDVGVLVRERRGVYGRAVDATEGEDPSALDICGAAVRAADTSR